MRLIHTHFPDPPPASAESRPEPASPALVLSAGTSPGVWVLHGRLNRDSRSVFDTLVDQPEGDLVLDLSDVSEADAGGLSNLVRLRNQRPGTYSRVTLRLPQRQVRDLLNLAGLERVFPIPG
jgi:ABC-type transporter Mla MlaB component